jgi:cystathionine beta-lyase
MLHYVERNIEYLIDYCQKNLPEIKPLRPDASFLVWLDCRDLKLGHDDLVKLFVDEAKLALNDGAMFGEGGEGFMRLNVATPRALLEQALTQLTHAINLHK